MELEKFDIDSLIYCYKAKCTVQWEEEHIRKDVCGLNSKLGSIAITQIESSQTRQTTDDTIFSKNAFIQSSHIALSKYSGA